MCGGCVRVLKEKEGSPTRGMNQNPHKGTESVYCRDSLNGDTPILNSLPVNPPLPSILPSQRFSQH